MFNPEYISWLMLQAKIPPEYSHLCACLFEISFWWSVDGDENRESDGVNLREMYVRDTGKRWPEEGVGTVLEILVALADRFDFLVSEEFSETRGAGFEIFLANLGLKRCLDDDYFSTWSPIFVNGIITRWLNREYFPNGERGLFPLKTPRKDQRQVEIWYQLQSYIMENL